MIWHAVTLNGVSCQSIVMPIINLCNLSSDLKLYSYLDKKPCENFPVAQMFLI